MNKTNQIKSLKFDLKIFRVLVYFLFFIIFLLFGIWGSWYYQYDDPKIDYSKLNETTKIYAEGLFTGLKAEYLKPSRSITFTTNSEDIKTGNGKDGYLTIGTNRNFDKSIDILILGDYNQDRITLCHELLHSIIQVSHGEYFVGDIAEQGVCYEKEKW